MLYRHTDKVLQQMEDDPGFNDGQPHCQPWQKRFPPATSSAKS